VVIFLGWFALAGAASACGEDIRPPFGLRWGESPERVLGSAKQTGVTARERLDAPGHATLELSFNQQSFDRVDFGFQSGCLIQVIVRYPVSENQGPGNELLGSLRGELEQGFGVGELLEIGREQNRDGYEETRRVFRWQKEGCALWLISLEVQSTGRGHAGEVTAVYANLGLSRRLEIDSENSGATPSR